MKITIYSDPGHAWAKISFKKLEQLGIRDKISQYSYERNNYAYIEEDCDLSVLIECLQEKNIHFSFKEYHTDKYSKIRGYNRYYNPRYVSLFT